MDLKDALIGMNREGGPDNGHRKDERAVVSEFKDLGEAFCSTVEIGRDTDEEAKSPG